MASPPGFAGSYRHRASFAVKILRFETDDFAIPTASKKSTLNERTKIRPTRVYEPLCFGVAEVPNLRRTCFTERPNAPPRLIAPYMTLSKSEIERGLEYSKYAVCAGSPSANSIMVVRVDLSEIWLYRCRAGAEARRSSRQVRLPLADHRSC